MLPNLRAYFILCVITVKCIKCMQEKIEFSFVTMTRVDLNQNFRRSLLGCDDKATIQNFRKILRGGILLPRGAFATPWLRAWVPSMKKGASELFKRRYSR